MKKTFDNDIHTTALMEHEAELMPELTPRQQQVLALIKAGKVNKEIANELGIGLGTVKQHVVALFKKLHVSNRAMAVSEGFKQEIINEPETTEIIEDGILERRPCIVLSIFLPIPALQTHPKFKEIVANLQKTFSQLAGRYEALFVPSKTHIGDLIFGVKRLTEQDIFKALRAARAVFDALAGYADVSKNMQGGLTAGLAICSMNRRGGWSGEVVASSVISEAREMAHKAAPGELALSASAKMLLEIIGPHVGGMLSSTVAFNTLNRMPWGKNIMSAQFPSGNNDDSYGKEKIIGREKELEQLERMLSDVSNGTNRLVFIEGETGMGKSLFCAYIANRSHALKARVHHFVCHSSQDSGGLFMFPSGAPVESESLLYCIKAVPGRSHDVIILEDAHLLGGKLLTAVIETVSAAQGKLVVIAARRLPKAVLSYGETIKLGHLSASAIADLIAFSAKGNEWVKGGSVSETFNWPVQQRFQSAESIADHASGVPLFAIELARHNLSDTLPLSLQVVINARMDGLKLDRMMLRRISQSAVAMTAKQIAEAMWEPRESVQTSLEQAVASGVLTATEDGHIVYAHPLLKQLISQSAVE